jgi:hypothetical protein
VPQGYLRAILLRLEIGVRHALENDLAGEYPLSVGPERLLVAHLRRFRDRIDEALHIVDKTSDEELIRMTRELLGLDRDGNLPKDKTGHEVTHLECVTAAEMK